MDTKLAEHQSLIECTIGEYAELYKRSDEPGVETLTVFDRERNHYILHTIGWAHLLTNRPPIRNSWVRCTRVCPARTSSSRTQRTVELLP